MRIVHVNTQDVAGGAAKIARLLAASQREAGHQSCMLVARRHGPGGRVRRFDAGFAPVLSPFCEAVGLSYLDLQGAFGLLAAEPVASADLLHLHNLHYGYFNPLALPAISRAKPCLWTLHDLHALTGYCNHPVDCLGWLSGCADCQRQGMDGPEPALDGRTGLTRAGGLRAQGAAITHRARALAYRHSRFTLACPSEWVRRQVERSSLAGHPVHVIPNGVETDLFAPGDRAAARRELGIAQDALVVGGVASYGVFANPIKGGALLLKALRLLWRSRPDLIFLNVGGFGQGPDPRVRNVPFVENPADLAKIYAAMDVFCHASQAETFCLVAVEAMACGIPVAAQRLGPLPEVVRHGCEGLLCDPGDAQDLAAALERLLCDPALRARLGASGRERAVAEYGLERMAARYSELSARVVEERAADRAVPPPMPLDELPALVKTPALLAAEGYGPGTAPAALDDAAGEALARAFLAELSEAARPPFAAVLAKVLDTARVFSLRGQGRFEEALELLSLLNAAWPEDMALLRTRGVTLELMGRREQALEAFQVCLSAHPPQRDVWLNISDLWRAAGNLDKAREALDAFAKVDPYLRGYNWRCGLLMQEAGRHRRAALAFLREVKLHGAPEAEAALRRSLRALEHCAGAFAGEGASAGKTT